MTGRNDTDTRAGAFATVAAWQGRYGLGWLAVALVGLALPYFAIVSYDAAGTVTPYRWMAVDLLVVQAAIVVLAIFDGWRPLRDERALPKYLRIALGLWFVGASVATVLSSNPALSIAFQAMWIVRGLFCLALHRMLSTRWQGLQKAFLIALAVGLLCHSLGVYWITWVTVGPDVMVWERFSFGVGNPRHYVFYADALLGLGLGFWAAREGKALHVLAAVLTFAAYHLFAWTGGRAAFGVAILAPLALAIVLRRRALRIAVLAALAGAAGYLVSLWTVPAHPFFGPANMIGKLSQNSYGGGDVMEYSSGRLPMWEAMLRESLSRPVFGHGQVLMTEFDAAQLKAFGMAMNPHNAAVQVVYDWGLVGVLAFAIGFLPFLRTLPARLGSGETVALPAFGVLLCLAISAGLDGTIFYTQPFFFIAIALAVLASVPAEALPGRHRHRLTAAP